LGNAITGAKAGVIAGIVYGVVLALLTYVTLSSMREEIITLVASSLLPDFPITAEQIYELALILGSGVVVVFGIVGGTVLGGVFGWAYEKIPGRTALVKGIIFGIIFWIIFSVLIGLGNLQYGTQYYLVNVSEGLVTSLIYGALVGYLYRRFIPELQS
jgi:vacuolar-type H+-ATPase subunit I/STV1